jgi:hypothetical protein
LSGHSPQRRGRFKRAPTHADKAYTDFQLALRDAFHGSVLCIMNISNGGYAYLTPRSMYSQGQYQVWQSPFAAGCLETMIDVCVQALAP